jgi:hypothetical protein
MVISSIWPVYGYCQYSVFGPGIRQVNPDTGYKKRPNYPAGRIYGTSLLSIYLGAEALGMRSGAVL